MMSGSNHLQNSSKTAWRTSLADAHAARRGRMVPAVPEKNRRRLVKELAVLAPDPLAWLSPRVSPLGLACPDQFSNLP